MSTSTPIDLHRRAWLCTSAMAAIGLPVASHAKPSGLRGWEAWKTQFMQADGRVMDTAHQHISHSEGQGFGMVLATAAHDRAAFDVLWKWTENNLRSARDDGLFAWRWEPGKGVTDRNTAADGDLLVAWALARAAKRFNHAPFKEQARYVAGRIREKMVVGGTPWGTVLKPGVMGFDQGRGLTVNLSYWVFPAFDVLNEVDPHPDWAALRTSGLRLLEIARFGRWGLPPDWLLLVNPLEVSTVAPPRHGLDAVRIPLYLHWAGLTRTPTDKARLEPFFKFWNHFNCASFLPAWANLLDNSIDSDGAEPGVAAIRTLVRTGKAPSAAAPKQSYYAATLGLLVEAAALEAGR